jgi:exopolyphosphatase/guanosine-5'-triphosphate,3'-diphosphate pyrophosphatase
VPLDLGSVGEGATLPLGPLRLAEFSDDERKLRDAVDRHIASVPWLRRYRGRGLYLVGGAWRALARIHMEQRDYPLHIIQSYKVPRHDAEQFFQLVGRLSRKSLEKMSAVSKKRIEAVPLAAFVLSRLVNVIEPNRLIFSAFGLREGLTFDLLPDAERRQDPLIAGCRAIAEASPRFGITGDELFEWTSPLYPVEDPRHRVLRLAVSLISDTAWSEHPDYRADEAFQRGLRMPLAGIEHGERVFIATALHARYGGPADSDIKTQTKRLIGEDDHAAARAIGLVLRLGYTLSAGAPNVLPHTRFVLRDQEIVLTVPDDEPLWAGETVQRRLDAIGRAFARKTTIRQVERKVSARV